MSPAVGEAELLALAVPGTGAAVDLVLLAGDGAPVDPAGVGIVGVGIVRVGPGRTAVPLFGCDVEGTADGSLDAEADAGWPDEAEGVVGPGLAQILALTT